MTQKTIEIGAFFSASTPAFLAYIIWLLDNKMTVALANNTRQALRAWLYSFSLTKSAIQFSTFGNLFHGSILLTMTLSFVEGSFSLVI